MISKKDLLLETGISYGQLYRWKREGLIPEEWFIKRPAHTGQETFFERDKIVGRISSIKELKAGHSLSEIINLLNPNLNLTVDIDFLVKKGILNEIFAFEAKENLSGSEIRLVDAAFLVALNRSLAREKITERSLQKFMRSSIRLIEDLDEHGGRIIVIEAWGEHHTMLDFGENKILFSSGVRIVKETFLKRIMSEIGRLIAADDSQTNQEL